MNNNYKSVGFGMQIFKDDMSSILIESVAIFAHSSRVFAQSLDLWAQSIEKIGTITKCVLIVNREMGTIGKRCRG
jgi:hypothetical protein